MHLGCLIVPVKDSQVVIGLMGLSEAAIEAKKMGHCWFPIGEPDPRYRGGRVWERVKVTAVGSIRANFDIIVIDNKKNVKEYAMASPLINEKTVMTNSANIDDDTTEKTDSFETAGYNKVTGLIYADQDLTIYVDQSIDMSNWDVVTTINYIGTATDGGFSVEIIAPYARVRFDNSSGSDTESCRKTVRLSAGA